MSEEQREKKEFNNDDYLSDEERRKENAERLEQFFKEFFFNLVLNDYMEGRPRRLLKKSSSSVPIHLCDELEKLWFANIKFAMLKKEEVLKFYWLRFTSLFSLVKEFQTPHESMVQHGEYYEDFWFGKKYFGEFVEILESYKKRNLRDYVNVIFVSKFSYRNRPSENEVKEIEDVIKEVINRFVFNLKDVRAELKDNLRGRFYWLKVSLKFATVYLLPWFVALVVIANFLKCNDSLGS